MQVIKEQLTETNIKQNQCCGQKNRYLNYLVDPTFQGVNTIFILFFENDAHRRSYNQYFLPTVEREDCNPRQIQV